MSEEKYPPQQFEAVRDAIAETLGDAYDCTRVWSAWGVGTMSQDDFVPVADDEDRLHELTTAALEASGCADLIEALREVERVLTTSSSAIVDTVWVSDGSPETLLDHVLAAISKATGAQS